MSKKITADLSLTLGQKIRNYSNKLQLRWAPNQKWLSDDFDLALEEFMNSSEVDFTPTLKNLKSIIKKLKGGR